MSQLPHLAAKLFNTPLMIHPMKCEVVMAALAERLGVVSLDNFAPRAVQPRLELDFDDFDDEHETDRDLGYDIIEGAALIQVRGTLVNKLRSLRPYSGMTGYSGIRQAYINAVNDPKVRGIVFDIESGGGEVAGCFDLCDMIYEQRKTGSKPHAAILSEYAYSAAFCLAAAVGNISIPRTGGAGSVGVIVIHADLSKAIKEAGIKLSILTYGDKKAEGRPEIPLSASARADIQADVDMCGLMFTQSVARYLNMPVENVINTAAGCFMGAKALDVGFAHSVRPPSEAFVAFIKSLGEAA